MMNDTVKRDNRKALPLFLLVTVLGGAIGAFVGFFGSMAVKRGMLDLLWTGLDQMMAIITPWAIPVSSAALLLPGFLILRAARKRYAAWDEEQEDALEDMERWLTYPLLLSTLATLLDFFFLSASFLYTAPLWNALFFLLSLGCIMVLQQKTVDLTRRINPEKQGSIYDLKFKKKWLDSCDEAERAQMGQAALHAFRAVSVACPILWCALTLLTFVTEIGLLPVFTITLVWGICQLSYLLACIRLNQRGAPL